jgi:ribosomal protein L44E
MTYKVFPPKRIEIDCPECKGTEHESWDSTHTTYCPVCLGHTTIEVEVPDPDDANRYFDSLEAPDYAALFALASKVEA